MEIRMELTFESLNEQDLTITTQDVLERIANAMKEEDFMNWLEMTYQFEYPTIDDIDYYIEDNENEVLAQFGLGEYDFIVNVKGIDDTIEFNWRDGDLSYRLPFDYEYRDAQWDVERNEIIKAICEVCIEEIDFSCIRIYDCDSGEYIYESEEEDEE